MAGDPGGVSFLDGMQKGTLEIVADHLNAGPRNDPVLSINLRDIKQVAKQVQRGYAMAKLVGRYKQSYTFMPQTMKGAAMEHAIDEFIRQIEETLASVAESWAYTIFPHPIFVVEFQSVEDI